MHDKRFTDETLTSPAGGRSGYLNPRSPRAEPIDWDAALRAELQRGPGTAALGVSLADAFEAEHGLTRCEELAAATTTGLLLYLPAILLLNAFAVTQPSWTYVGLQCTATPLLALSVAHWAFRRCRKPYLREWGAAIVACCFSISATANLSGSLPASAPLAGCLVTAMAAGALLLARLRIMPAFGFLLVSAIALIAALLQRDGPAEWSRLYPLVFFAAVAAPVMASLHRQQCTARLTYLREKQQALRIQALTSENSRLSALSATDPVTGAANRRHLENVLTAICGCNAAGDFLLLADIDFFKRFNDRHGHLAGDAALRLVTETMRRQIRRGDVLARYGGEEFAVILSRTTREDALATAERIRTDVANQDVLVNGVVESINISVGVAERQKGDTAAMLIAAADIALYQAKRGGRNCVREARIAMPALT